MTHLTLAGAFAAILAASPLAASGAVISYEGVHTEYYAGSHWYFSFKGADLDGDGALLPSELTETVNWSIDQGSFRMAAFAVSEGAAGTPLFDFTKVVLKGQGIATLFGDVVWMDSAYYQVTGRESFARDIDVVASLNNTVAPVPLGAAGLYLLGGLGTFGLARRRRA